MNEQKLKEIAYYFDGYGSPHDDDILKLIDEYKRYREALEEIKKEETVTTALSEGQVAYTFSGHIARKVLESEK